MQIGKKSQYNKAYTTGYLGIQWPNNKINGEKNKDFKGTLVVLVARY
jgi:hypothetical protein